MRRMVRQRGTTRGRCAERQRAARTWPRMAVFTCVTVACIYLSACGSTDGVSVSTAAAPTNTGPATREVPVRPTRIKGATRHREATGAVTTATTSQKPKGAVVNRTVASAVTGCLSRAGIVGAPDHAGSTPTQGLIKSGAPVTTSEYTATLRRCGLPAGRR
jgi:hypothetical protein